MTHKPEENLMIENKKQAQALLPTLSKFVSKMQIEIIKAGFDLEEKQFFFDTVEALCNTFNTMPKSYETDGQGDNAIAHLHYFVSGNDWYITEKDQEDEQHQAFGVASLSMNGNTPELGYISIEELMKNNVEIDFHFEPKALKEINND